MNTNKTMTTFIFQDTCGRLSEAILDEANAVIASAATEHEAWALLESYEAAKTAEHPDGWRYGLLDAVAEVAVLVEDVD
jgi:hypothetical protein